MARSWRRRDLLIAVAGGAAVNRSAAAGPGIKFKDPAGNEIILAAPARRIVDLWTTGAAFAIAAHGSPVRLVGVNDHAHSIFKRGLIGRLYPEVLDIPSDVMIGGSAPNIERLVTLNPDLVVDMRENSRDQSAAMKNAGLAVASYGKVPGGVSGNIQAVLLMFGRMIGDTSRAEQIIAVMNAALKRLAGIDELPQAARPDVLLMMPFGGRFYASGGGPGGIYSDFIYAGGGRNAAEALPDFSEVTSEQIAALDPDVMLIFQSEDADPALIYEHPILGGVAAAGARRVHVVPIGANNWGSLGPDEYLSQMWLAELLHPDLLDRRLRSDMREAYAAIFDRSFSDDILDEILRMDLNGGSAGYARFRSG